jgi:hypothetical protein
MNGSDVSDKDKMVGYGRPPAATRQPEDDTAT